MVFSSIQPDDCTLLSTIRVARATTASTGSARRSVPKLRQGGLDSAQRLIEDRYAGCLTKERSVEVHSIAESECAPENCAKSRTTVILPTTEDAMPQLEFACGVAGIVLF